MNALETEVCGRCGGTGNYSYCTMYGTTCFKCQGRKRVYTKRGAKALAYLTALRSKPASEIKVGDVILCDSTFSKSKFSTVTKIEIEPCGEQTRVNFTTGIMGLGVFSDTPIRVAQTQEQKEQTLKLALEYQDTLTKTGTVRKTSTTKGSQS